MRKLSLFIVFIFCIVVNLKAQDCAPYHKGYYKLTDSAGTVFLIDRQKNYQYQYDRVKKIRSQFRIKWIDDCTYTITQTSTNSKAAKKFNNSTTKITISLADGINGYYYSCACLDDSNKKENKLITKITKREFYQLY